MVSAPILALEEKNVVLEKKISGKIRFLVNGEPSLATITAKLKSGITPPPPPQKKKKKKKKALPFISSSHSSIKKTTAMKDILLWITCTNRNKIKKNLHMLMFYFVIIETYAKLNHKDM